MNEESSSRRRLARLRAQLLARGDDSGTALGISVQPTGAGGASVRIGDVSLDIEAPPPGCEALVPVGFLDPAGEPQDVLRVLRFLMQKDSLGQDAYLIGPPGPLRREVVLKYCELVQRPVEYVALSQDTTESDLKQRREITSGTATYVDCAAVRAAIMGSVLVLDGIEKAERNVMPLLNNLLENREMALEDGRFLVHPKRYDALLEKHSPEELSAWKLVRTSHRFRVVALGLPIPRYPGSALDPPFRSRFQARDVPSARPADQLETIQAQLTEWTDATAVRLLVQAGAVLSDLRHSDGGSAMSAIPEFPQGFERVAAQLFERFPLVSPRAVLDFVFPFPSLLEGSADDRGAVVVKVLARFSLLERPAFDPEAAPPRPDAMVVVRDGAPVADEGAGAARAPDALDSVPLCNYVAQEVVALGAGSEARVRFRLEALNRFTFEYLKGMSTQEAVVSVPAGDLPPAPSSAGFVETMTNLEHFSRMLQAHAVGDFCVIGEKGGGKSALVHYFARRLGYRVEHIPLYKDIAARGLLQRRVTHPNGDTDWENSSLVVAALTGRIAVLDGVEQMIPGTLASLQMLVAEREARLPDGRRLVSHEQFELMRSKLGLSAAELTERHGVLAIHPAFRIIALARPSGAKGGGSPTGTWRDWLGSEVQSMFRFVFVGPLRVEEQKFILRTLAPRVHVQQLDRLIGFAAALRAEVAKDEMLSALLTAISLRSMIRICRRVSAQQQALGEEGAEDEAVDMQALYDAVLSAALSRFLPPLVLETLLHLLRTAGIHAAQPSAAVAGDDLTITVLEGDQAAGLRKAREAVGVLRIGGLVVDIMPPKDVLLIPDILFYDNPRQSMSMREMVKDWMSGQHLLLIGNQGVGKNKLADRMLQLLRLPREYIQLHRDTTVQNLTSNPTIVNGVLQYEDSPLVRAAREGRVLVVDEADKAPTHVTAILKALVEDRSMLLSDGRRILDPEEAALAAGSTGDIENIPLHPEFRLIALANRPGFPFHGNDFFREVGDVFACHAIDNPDANSEMYLLKQYGPDVPEDTLRKLIASFDELRGMSDDGQLSYPYSTRELTAIVKHMQRYPRDGVDRILRNVFDFDNYNDDEKQLLMDVFSKNGVPFSVGNSAFHVSTGRTRALPPPRLVETWALAARAHPAQPRPAAPAAQHLKASRIPLTDALRLNQSSRAHMWPLKPPHSQATLQRAERSSTVFTEELYSFKLPQGLVVGLTQLRDGSLAVAARSHSFMLFHIDPQHSRCLVHDLHGAIPSDGLYRVAPNSANILPMSGEARTFDPERPNAVFDVLVQNPSTGNMIAIDLANSQFAFLELPVGCDRKGPKMQVVQCAAPRRDRFLVFQRGRRFVTVVDYAANAVFTTSDLSSDPPRRQLAFGVDRVDALTDASWLVTSTPELGKTDFETYVLTLDEREGVFAVERLDRREPSPELAKAATLPTFASSSAMSESPAALASAGHTVRMVQLKQPNGPDGERIPAMAVNLPQAFDSGSRAHIYQVDHALTVSDTGAEAEEAQPPATGSEAQPSSGTKVTRIHAQQLERSNLMAVVREAPDRMAVDLELYDLNRANRRTLTVSLEDDVLNNDDPDLRIRGSGAKVDQAHGTAVRHSPNLANLKNVLSPSQLNMFAMRRATIGEAAQKLFVTELSGQAVCTVDCLGHARVWLVDDLAIRQAFADWRKLVGQADEEPLKILIEGDDDKDGSSGSGDGAGEGEGGGEGEGNGIGKGEGEGEGEGTGGEGGGQIKGGSGGGNMSGKAKGLGADKIAELPDPSELEFQEIQNPSAEDRKRGPGGDDDDDQVSEEVHQATSDLKREEWLKILQKLDMSEHDADKYEKYKDAVKTEIRELRVTLEGLEANETERVWLKNQTTGDLDDMRLIDGLTGERSIYKRRADQSPDASWYQPMPKKLHLLFDLSMSIGRYAADGRLQRSLEAAVMILEAIKGFEQKFDVRFSGHSGDSDNVRLGVEFGHPVRDDKERLTVIKKMNAHIQACDSGDTTIPAIRKAVDTMARDGRDADGRYIFAVSDANLDQYGITPEHFERLMASAMQSNTHLFVLFIASMGDQASVFEERLPGKVFTCLDKTAIPKTLKKMFLAAASASRF